MSESTSFNLADEFASFGDDLMGKSYEGNDVQMVVVKAETGASAKGKVFIRPTLRFDGGPNSGKEVVDTLYWSPQSETAVRIFASSLAVLGAPAAWVKETKPSMQQICERIKGQKVQVNLKKDEFNGQPQTRVSYRKNLSGGSAHTPGAPMATPSASAAVSLDDEPAAGVGTPAAAVTAAAPAAPAAAAPVAAAPVAEAPAAAGDPWA